jgi:crotonobetainyl-CoA:carnitine CoA-transferase CaiB-like acyl-CoA transferase
VLTVDQALAHPHTRHRGMVLEQGDYRGVGSPIKLSRTPAALRRLPPALAPAARDE